MFGVVHPTIHNHAKVELLRVADDALEPLHRRGRAPEGRAGQTGHVRLRVTLTAFLGRRRRRAGDVHGESVVYVERREREVLVQVSHRRRRLLGVRGQRRGGVAPEELAAEFPALPLDLHGELPEELDVARDLLKVGGGHRLEVLERG